MAKAVASCVMLGFAGAAQLKASKSSSAKGCGVMTSSKKRSLAHAHLRTPGAGLEEFEPFENSYSDGFMMLDCVKDYMHTYGDKFGDGKFSYALGAVSNVSIVHYTDVVPREDQEQITHEVCFGFCRSVPNMGFFGITNGRDCYCTPYYRQEAGDSSACDTVCDGDATTICGGKTKSSIFSMHACNDHAENLVSATASCEETREKMVGLTDEVLGLATKMQDLADALQPELGNVGDSAATAHLQAAKVFAGELQHSGEAAREFEGAMEALETASGSHDAAGPVPATEKLTAELKEGVKTSEKHITELQGLKKEAAAPDGNARDLYYPVMYFVDKEFKDAPSTCGGKTVGEPIVGSFGGCAQACEATAGKCVGFSYFAKDADGLCFLLSELDSATYYTGCPTSAPAAAAFLQKKSEDSDYDVEQDHDVDYDAEPDEAHDGHYCGVKFANFDGTTLKPDPSGKCKGCLKEAKKADRCPYAA